nr:Pol polyprotein [Tanacetum cinerariifolium]
MFMGNGTTSKIEGKGKVILKPTSGKDLVLLNVLHVPNITKNMISSPILSNKGFKLVFESNKFVITKGGVYVGKGHLDEGLFKLSVATDDNVINNNNAGTSTASVYMVDPSFLCHSRLGHVNFRSLQRMINLGMLSKCSKDKISKCEICVESKFTSHSHSKFCYVYLINTKDEALNMFKTYKAEVENQLDKKIKILSKRAMNGQLSQDETDNNSKVPQENIKPRRSKRAKVTKDFGPDYMTYIMNEEPQKYKAAIESSESPYWKEAIQNDMLIMGTNMDVITQTKKMLHSSFDMKDMGEADVILEFVALDKAAEEAEWLRSFLEGIPLWPKPVTAMCIHRDSMAALTRAKNQIYNGKSRHIRRHHNMINDLLRNGIISIDYVKSKENIADPLSKGLYREQVIFTSRGMGLKLTQ